MPSASWTSSTQPAKRRPARRSRPVRCGSVPSPPRPPGSSPRALASLPPELTVTLREGTTLALIRALRAGTLDLAILARTPPYLPPGRRGSCAPTSPRCPSASWSSPSPPTTRSPVCERSRSASSSGQVWVAFAVRHGRATARRVARPDGTPRGPLRRTRLARQAPDRRCRPGHHHARPDHARRPCPATSRPSPCAGNPRRPAVWCCHGCPGRSIRPPPGSATRCCSGSGRLGFGEQLTPVARSRLGANHVSSRLHRDY